MPKPAKIQADDLFLRHKTKGTVYGWTQEMAKVAVLEEVSGKEAFPELFAPKSEKTKKVPQMDIGDTGEEPPVKKNAEVNKDASRGLKVG